MHDEEMKVFLLLLLSRKKVISVTFSAVVAGHTPMTSRTLFKAISADAVLESRLTYLPRENFLRNLFG